MDLIQNLEDLLDVDPAQNYFPEFLNGIETYNKTIRETNTGEKFEQLINKIADDPNVTPGRMQSLAEMISRDLVLVHNDQSFTFVLNMVHSVLQMLSFYHLQHT